MKTAVLLYFTVLLLLSPLSAKENTKMNAIAYLADGLDEIKHKEIRIAFRLWTSEVVKMQNVEVDTLYYSDHEKIVQDYQKQVFGAMTLSPMYYLKHQEVLDAITEDYYIVQRRKTHYEKMLLLVRKDSQIKNLKDLKGKVVGTKSDSYQARFFLDKEMLEELHITSKRYIRSMTKTEEFSTAVLNVFFKKIDACVVPEYIFNLICEMNPAVGRSISSIVESQNIFMPAMTVLHKDTPVNLREVYRKSISSLDKTVKGKNILTLFKMHRIRFIEVSELDKIKKYYAEYLALKKRYRVKND